MIEADEIWTIVQKKQLRLTSVEERDGERGDQYTFIGFDPSSKLIAAHVVGKRDAETTTTFIEQLRARIPHRIQFFTDGFPEYQLAVEGIYGRAIDYAQVIKPVKPAPGEEAGHLDIVHVLGHPDVDQIGTSYVERHNLTIRQQIRRFTRKTLGFSKWVRNLRAAVALYVAHYNFCRPHSALRMTPAMALGITTTFWSLEDLLSPPFPH